MRKRSGAFHSDTEQQYLKVRHVVIELAEIADQTCGLFYDEKINKKCFSKLKQEKQQQLTSKFHTFEGFDFNEIGLEEKENCKQLSTAQQIKIINATVVTDEIKMTFQYLLTFHQISFKQDWIDSKRKLDLLIVNKDYNNTKNILLKIWVLDKSVQEQQIYSFYVSKIENIFRVEIDPNKPQQSFKSLSVLIDQLFTI